MRLITITLAAFVFGVGVLGGLSTLDRGIWLDEFIMLISTPKEQTASELLNVISHDVHPLLYFGIVQQARWAGLTDIATLRAFNLLGVALTGWSIWFALRRGALEFSSASVLIALYLSSAITLGYLGELRNYFITYSASIALSLFWLVMVRGVTHREAWDARVVIGWFFCLTILVNSHYFATLLGAVMTVSVLAPALAKRRWRGAALVAAVSLLGAAPAIGMAIAQMLNERAEIMTWIGTGRAEAAFLMLDSLWLVAGTNFVAVSFAITTTFLLLDRRNLWPELHAEIMLSLTVGAVFFLVFLIHLYLPIVQGRYLIAISGPVVLIVARLATRPPAPTWGAATICGFALLVQARTLYEGDAGRDEWWNGRDGWATSSSAVAEAVSSCSGTRVYTNAAFERDSDKDSLVIAARRYGQGHYAARFDFSTEEIRPGDVLPPADACPTLIWVEHVPPPRGDRTKIESANDVLNAMGVVVSGHAEVFFVGSGMLVVVR